MKKITLIMSVVIMAVLLAFGAAAAEIFPADADKAFDITYTGTPGEYYAIVIVEGIVDEGSVPSISEDSIQYIDQKTAGANGTVSFEDVLLFEDDTPATVFLGGSDLDDGAIVLGWVNKTEEEVDTFTFSGAVTSGTKKPATVTLTNVADAAKTYTADTIDGVYTISGIEGATYQVVITAPGQLSYTKSALLIEADATYKDITLKSGNVTSDDKVDKLDLSAVLSNYGKMVETGDCTGDVKVDKLDLSAVLANYGSKAVVEN